MNILRHEAVLSKYRLTISQTEVEFWEYERGFLAHAREHVRVFHDDKKTLKSRRKDNLTVVRNTVRRLVNSNVGQYGYEACFLTFTYKRNETDINVAWADWHSFFRRLRDCFGSLHALTVMEFQKRGAVHFHCIFFNLPPDVEARERSERTLAQLWGHGFVDVERVRSARNVGAYVCKYLNKSANDERLRGKKFYSTTRNLIKPKEYVGEFAKAKMQSILFTAGSVDLLAETTYEYGGLPVIYRNYKIIKNELCSS